MRGRRQTTSSVSQKQTRMALRKRVVQDSNDIPLGNQGINGNTQEDGALDENNDECSLSLLSPSSSRGKRRRERENKSKPKEMTEEEMMDLALRLSEEEASITALRQQNEEEAMMKAIQDSMVSQTQPCSPSQNVRADEASLRISSRRKLLYLNGKVISAIDPGPSGDGSTPGTIRNPGVKRSGDEGKKNKKRRRKEGSPLLEMPDLSQTQKIDSQVSSCRSEVLDLTLDSQQSSDSTQMEDSQPQESPTFPLTGCKAKVQLPLLSQDRPQTCRTSGSQWCSQDTCTSPQKSLSAQPKSPTFPKSPKISSDLTLFKSTASPKSPVFSETDPGGDGETEPSPLFVKSLVFGRNTQHEKSPSAYKPQVGVCNSGFMSSSQESLASSVTSVTCRPKSPVFPGSPKFPQERSATCKSPVFSEIDGAETERIGGRCKSPVFGRTGPKCGLHLQKRSASRPAAELRGSRNKGKSDASEGPSQRQDSDHNQEVRLKESSSDDADEELRETSKNPQVEPTSNMTLLWSDGDDDVTLVGSSSPVFPEEGPARQAESQNQATAASPGTSGLNCRPSSSSASAAQREPISSEGVVSRPSAPPASTVHYYWGVPFCPRGLDPDDYTQVILAQMEVYEKSLKQAQRCLLRKAEWGEAILPQPEKSPSPPESPAESPQQSLPQRRKLRSKKRRDTDDAPAAEVEVEEESKEEEEEREHKEEDMKNEGEEELDGDDCDVCPETQLHEEEDDDGTQDLTMDTGAELGHKSQEPPEVEMILQDDSPAREEFQKVEEEEEMDVEVDVDVETEPNTPEDQKMKGNSPVGCCDAGGQHVRETLEAEEDRRDSDVEEGKHQGLPRSMSPELELAVVPQMPVTSMECPICQGSFPVTEIEMHAAYCDGEVAVADTRRSKAEGLQASLKPRRKRTRRAEATAEDTNSSSGTVGNQEKCYICQKLVPLRDYSKHTEVCIQQQRSKAAAKENLLSALEKTDSRDSEAGPSGSKLRPGDIIDLRDDDEDGSIPATSSSPIRSFTSISEATDCLIDFRKQHRTKKTSHRRR